MSLWLVRAGSYGEHESKFIEDKRVYLTWGELTAQNLTGIPNYDGIKQAVLETYPGEPTRRLAPQEQTDHRNRRGEISM
jgi:restriction system protein